MATLGLSGFAVVTQLASVLFLVLLVIFIVRLLMEREPPI